MNLLLKCFFSCFKQASMYFLALLFSIWFMISSSHPGLGQWLLGDLGGKGGLQGADLEEEDLRIFKFSITGCINKHGRFSLFFILFKGRLNFFTSLFLRFKLFLISIWRTSKCSFSFWKKNKTNPEISLNPYLRNPYYFKYVYKFSRTQFEQN